MILNRTLQKTVRIFSEILSHYEKLTVYFERNHLRKTSKTREGRSIFHQTGSQAYCWDISLHCQFGQNRKGQGSHLVEATWNGPYSKRRKVIIIRLQVSNRPRKIFSRVLSAEHVLSIIPITSLGDVRYFEKIFSWVWSQHTLDNSAWIKFYTRSSCSVQNQSD